METAEEILSGNDYFTCERFQCTMRRAVCLGRQAPKLVQGGGFNVWTGGLLACRDCDQGREISGRPKSQSAKRRVHGAKRAGAKPTVSQDGVREGYKLCFKCMETKKKDAGFYKDPRHHDGYKNICKACMKSAQNERRGRRRKTEGRRRKTDDGGRT